MLVNYLVWLFLYCLILDESSQTKKENKNAIINPQDIPSTSKTFSFQENEDNISKRISVDQQHINESIYFASKSIKTEELNIFNNDSPTIESDNSNDSFSENSVNFSPEESLSEDDEKLQGLFNFF